MSSVEQRARELLAESLRKHGRPRAADAVLREGRDDFEESLDAIAAALREQPEARGVVDDDAIARVFMSLRIPFKIAAGEPITPEDWFDFGRACAALTAAQQPAQAAPVWKLVPVEATDAMQEAFNDWRPTEGNKYAGAQSVSAQDRWEFRQRYAAMLAAAPTPPGDDAAGGGHD